MIIRAMMCGLIIEAYNVMIHEPLNSRSFCQIGSSLKAKQRLSIPRLYCECTISLYCQEYSEHKATSEGFLLQFGQNCKIIWLYGDRLFCPVDG